MIRTLTYFLLGFLLSGVSIFAVQNQQSISLKFLNLESINLPLGLVLVFSTALGAIVITALQVSSLRGSRSQFSNTQFSNTQVANPQGSKSRPKSVKTETKDKIGDFDDEFDDDWV
jgi:uncharacterized integral membrane protein